MSVTELQSEVEKLVDVLRSFPPEQQEALAARYRVEAEHIRDVERRIDNLPPQQVERLRAMIQEGLDSGPAEPMDWDAFKAQARARLNAER
ncbi:MAG: type II toxin-antitoxin system ParD family antitoxin [Bacteroidota bacterium]